MSRSEIEVAVLHVSQRLLGPGVSLNTRRDLTDNWDSLAHVDLIFSIEDEFDVSLPSEVLENLNTLREFVEAVERIHAP